MSDPTQRFPLEILAEILGHLTFPDVVRLKEVNRAFRDVILGFPLIQHKIDLFAAGLKYNEEAGVNLADSRKTFQQSKLKPYSLRPVEQRTVDDLQFAQAGPATAAGGVFAILQGDSVRLFTLGSVSRGIQHKEWVIPRPATPLGAGGYCFDPGADVIAFVELQQPADMQIIIHLRTMSDGVHHPAVQCSTINYSKRGNMAHFIASTSMTSSRLVILAGGCLVIFDWRSAQVLLELKGRRYEAAEFINNYRLLVSLGSTLGSEPPSLMLIDTEADKEGSPVQTIFHLSPHYHNLRRPILILERGAHKPSPAETLAPFYQDPTQRIVVLHFLPTSCYLAIRVEGLSKLLETHEGSEIRWDEWKSYVMTPSSKLDLRSVWISGCKLFASNITHSGLQMKMYDFSMKGRAQYLSERVRKGLGTVKYMSPTGARVQIPLNETKFVHVGHDSIVFTSRRFSVGDPFIGRRVLHIWTY